MPMVILISRAGTGQTQHLATPAATRLIPVLPDEMKTTGFRSNRRETEGKEIACRARFSAVYDVAPGAD
jgi:hypothetical protein